MTARAMAGAIVSTLAALAAIVPAMPAHAQSAGDVFRDCPECPEMVVVPAGRFTMGSNDGYDDERPVHEVTIPAPFAIGKYEVTFAEWDACSAAGGCDHWANDASWGRGNHPVINVSWDNAREYVAWLSRRTGHAYRLPSEAEWEYAARAGTTTAYWWGRDVGQSEVCTYANGADLMLMGNNKFSEGTTFDCRDGHTGPAPVGSFPANPYGLHDVAGNLWEWVEDCWADSYRGAPTDGRAWVSSDCSRRVLRGGSWRYYPQFLSSANRLWHSAVSPRNDTGFRVVRTN